MDWISSLLLATVRLAIPVLLISLAELYGQRAGMVNIGLEGLASIGALVGFLVCYITGSNWLGLLCGALAGIAVNMIYAFSTITLCANHTVYGMAINIFAPALASFIYRVYFGTGSDLKQIVTMSSVAIPGLKDIPVIGAGAAGVHPAQGSAAFPYSSDRRVAQQHSGAFEISGSDVAVPEKDLLHTGGSSQECFLLLRGEDQGVDDFFHGKTSLFCRTGRCLGWGCCPGIPGSSARAGPERFLPPADSIIIPWSAAEWYNWPLGR